MDAEPQRCNAAADTLLQEDADGARKALQHMLRAVAQRREAIVQGADNIMKVNARACVCTQPPASCCMRVFLPPSLDHSHPQQVSNAAAKDFDKSVLAAMLQARTARILEPYTSILNPQFIKS